MVPKVPIYKGLQKPLIYKGFKGKFIAWGIGSLIAGLVMGGLTIALGNMYLGVLTTLGITAGGLTYTFHFQKGGLHSKHRSRSIFVQPAQLKLKYVATKERDF